MSRPFDLVDGELPYEWVSSQTDCPASNRLPRSAAGQLATFTDASRVFVLSVRNREANQALPGQEWKCGAARNLLQSRRSAILKGRARIYRIGAH
jgi:hypothetical protein